MEILANCVFACLILFIIIGFSISYIKEKKEWNKGRCSKCGCKLNLMGYNLDKDRIYRCNNRWCSHYCKISYKTIDGGKENEIF